MQITILGCGWLGCALGTALLKEGHHVLGTYRSSKRATQIANLGITPVFWDGDCFTPSPIWLSDVLIMAFPPDQNSIQHRAYSDLVLAAANNYHKYNKTGQVFFMSSTGVYKETRKEVHEKSRLKFQHKVAIADFNLQKNPAKAVILRLGGLCGGDRWPAKYMAGRQDLAGGNAPVNLVHQADVVGVIMACIAQKIKKTVLNVCADKHPTKSEIYTHQCIKLGLPIPHFEANKKTPSKTVSNKKLYETVQYQFKFPDPMMFE